MSASSLLRTWRAGPGRLPLPLLLALLLALFPAPPRAAGAVLPGGAAVQPGDPTDPRQAREELRERMAALLAEREQAQEEIDRLSAERDRLAAMIDDQNTQAQKLIERREELDRRLREAREDLEAARRSLEEKRGEFNRRLVARYLHSRGDRLNLLLDPREFFDEALSSLGFRRILDADLEERRNLELKKAGVAALQSGMALQKNEEAELDQERQKQENRLGLLTGRLDEVQISLQNEKGRQEKSIASLKEAEARLVRTFGLDRPPTPPPPPPEPTPQPAPQPAPVYPDEARPAPPVEGTVLGRAGPGGRGISLLCREGAQVRTPWAGRVVYSSVIKGYGRVVVLDHGQRMHTVLGRLGDVSVDLGKSLAAGEVVGSVGEGGVLYLEVRRATKAVNPLDTLDLGP